MRQDSGHVDLTRRLIPNDVLVLDTGCAAVTHAKTGSKMPAAAREAGPSLQAICGVLGVAPFLHVGSCVDNVHIVMLAAALVNTLNTDIADLPLAAAPEWHSEQAAALMCRHIERKHAGLGLPSLTV
jgi:anaerobic carbon-monoxide dehydrogenase catalytic subunit